MNNINANLRSYNYNRTRNSYGQRKRYIQTLIYREVQKLEDDPDAYFVFRKPFNSNFENTQINRFEKQTKYCR